MKLIVRNNAGIPNKNIRFIKWKIRTIDEKLNINLPYAEVFVSKEGKNPTTYSSTLKLGIPGHDIVLNNKSTDLKGLWKKSSETAFRYLRKYKQKINANYKYQKAI